MSPLVSGLASVASMIFNAVSSGAGKASARRGGEAATPEPSAMVTLSPEAQALAGIAGQGVLLAQSTSAGAGGAGGAMGRVAAQGGTARVSGPAAGAVSKEDFQALLTRFGANEAQKQQLTQGFDADKDGVISRNEFLQGLARTRGEKAGGDAFSQAVLQVMDRAGNADGSVTKDEFTALSTAFALAERPARRV